MNIDAQVIAAEYDGFLNALRCFLGYRRVFGCFLLDKKAGYLENHIKRRTEKLECQYVADYNEIRSLFGDYLFKPLASNGYKNLENAVWNVFEYYGLISTALDESGPWNPMVSGKTIVLEFFSTESAKTIEFIVEVGGIAVVTYLASEI